VSAPPSFDPLEPSFVDSPYDRWSELRARCPVARGTRWGGFWALTRYDDILRVSSSYADFTSSLGITIPKNPVSGRRAPLHFDPPEHTRYRRAINAPLREERVAALEPRIREIARSLLAPLVERGEGDAVAELTSPLAGLVMAEFIHVEGEQAAEIMRHGELFERAQFRYDGDAAERENVILYDACRRLVAGRRREPLDPENDLVSALLALRVDGEPLDDEFVAGSVRQYLIAAHVAPTAAIASGILHLAEDVELQERLRGNPREVPAAVEELLRLHTPNQGFARSATRDLELHGCPIKAGDMVALVLTSANRDEEVFDRAQEVDLGRPVRHVAFGHGAHKCPGSHVARAEFRIALEELLGATESFERAGEVEQAPWPLHGPTTLPLRFRAAAA
jgi:cytochrome P450